MCSKVICRNCNKPTWSGCGEHIEEALAGVALEDRCSCTQPNNDPPSGTIAVSDYCLSVM